jgi:hemolysin III
MHVWIFREPASAWTHLAGMALSIPGLWLLWERGRGNSGKRISLLSYGVSLILCYGASTLYHGVWVPSDRLGPFIRLDSEGIFALIAGSYTPLAWNLMRGRWRAGTLSVVWGTAISAIALIASGRRFSPILGTSLYLAMGWGVVVCYARVARVISHRGLLPLVLGGLSYSVGAVLNLLSWPALWPGVFGTHALFHLFVIAGSLAHFWFILKVVVPFEWASSEHDSTAAARASDAVTMAADTLGSGDLEHSGVDARPARRLLRPDRNRAGRIT